MIFSRGIYYNGAIVLCIKWPANCMMHIITCIRAHFYVTNQVNIYIIVYIASSLTCRTLQYIQCIPRNMHTVFALLCFVVVIHWLIFPYPSGLLHWHCGNLTIAPVPAKQPWWIWINTSCEFIMNDCITTTKQSTTKPCAYFLGYTVGGRGHPDKQIIFSTKLYFTAFKHSYTFWQYIINKVLGRITLFINYCTSGQSFAHIST